MERIFTDYVWGEIRVDQPFTEILEWPEVRAMQSKLQLGICKFNDAYAGGTHSRFEHSIGVFHLTQQLIYNLNSNLCSFLEISKRDENILKLLALFHDIGHGPFSHSFEAVSKVSHEEATRSIIISLKSKINALFDENMTDDLISFFDSKEKIKNSPALYKSTAVNFDILTAFIDLLAGSVDVDRIDYIARDSLSILGVKKDFSHLLKFISLDVVDDKPQIVFDYHILETIEDYLLARFRMYSIYYHSVALLKEEFFKDFVLASFAPEDISVDLTEYEIECSMKDAAASTGTLSRLAKCILHPFDKKLLHKTFSTLSDYTMFVASLRSYIEFENEYSGGAKRTITVYDPEKNKLYIRNINGEIEDLADVSQIINGTISREIHLCYVDLELLFDSLVNQQSYSEVDANKVLMNVYTLFTTSKYEIEKKLTVGSVNSLNLLYTLLSSNLLPNASCIYSCGTQKNIDSYFDTGNERISARSRKIDELTQYTIKIRSCDESSLTKRIEENYNDIDEDYFLELLNSHLAKNSLSIVHSLDTICSISTSRKKMLYTFADETEIEIAFDICSYSKSKKVKTDFMIEFELISGNPVQLLRLYNLVLSQTSVDLEPCNESKLQRCLKFFNN